MYESILIVKLSSMGDVVHTLPAAQALRRAFPHAHLGWAVERAHAELLSGQPWLDEVLAWDRRARGGPAWLVRKLRSRRWELAIDFQGLLRSALVTRASGARHRLGWRQAKELAPCFYTERFDRPTMNRHAVERSLELISSLGASWPGVPMDRPYLKGERPTPPHSAAAELFPLHPQTLDIEAVDQWTSRQRWDWRQPLVVLNPHCRKAANRWPAARFAALAARLVHSAAVRVALIGGAASRQLCDEIAAGLGGHVARADGQFGLLASTELLRRARVLVTGDTGPMHLAVAMGTPVVALFGPADPLRTGPYASDAIVLRERLPCAPCFARKCPLRYDPPLCMDRLSVESVYDAVLRQLDRREGSADSREAA